MAQPTAQRAEPKTRTYVLEVTFTVDFTADEHVQSPQAIRNEARSNAERRIMPTRARVRCEAPSRSGA